MDNLDKMKSIFQGQEIEDTIETFPVFGRSGSLLSKGVFIHFSSLFFIIFYSKGIYTQRGF